jgi:hypothetical protein
MWYRKRQTALQILCSKISRLNICIKLDFVRVLNDNSFQAYSDVLLSYVSQNTFMGR